VKYLFESATVKLTLWYLLILMAVSILFSFAIFSAATNEMSQRLKGFEVGIIGREGIIFEPTSYPSLRSHQMEQAAKNLLSSLALMNLIILLAGGVGAYLLAKHTLRPIEEALDAQARFTSDASHELRTPLAAMRMETELALKDTSMKPAQLRETLQSNLEEITTLTELTSTLLSLAQKNDQSLQVEPVSIETLVTKAASRFPAYKSRIEIEKNDNSKPLIAKIHPGTIEEVITILLDNAIKYSYPSSKITIKFTKKAPYKVAVHIENSGDGIAEKDLPHIFSRFYQANNARSGADHGYGLGLALAKKLTKLNRGNIDVKSTPGKITRFTLTLPQ